jgi:hypothetical protein
METVNQWLLGFTSFFLAGLIVVTLSYSPVQSLEPMEPTEMSTISGAGGLGIQFNLQISNGAFQIKDNDGRFGGGAQGWLVFSGFSADISPTDVGDNTIYLDANQDFIQFSAPNPITGSLSIDEIETRQNRTSTSIPEIAAFYIGDHSDGVASFDFHDTKLKLY